MIAVIRFPWAPGPAAPIRICGEEPEKHGVRAESRGDSLVGINKFTEPLGEHQLADPGHGATGSYRDALPAPPAGSRPTPTRES